MRRERRGGDADAEAPQAFKEGASTLRNAQNRIHISCSASAWGLWGGDRLSMLGAKEEGATHYRVAAIVTVGNYIAQGERPKYPFSLS
jgi:hypothetical protein